MLSDWIKMRTDLYRDPKVSIMADCLMADRSALSRYVNQNMQCDMSVTRNVMRNAVCGALISVWGVMRHQGKRDGADLVVDGIDEITIDDVAELQGFGEAMMIAGWLDATPVDPDTTRLRFPKFFAENNVDPQEESRKKNAERQRRYRESKCDSNVTGNVTRDADVTSREEREKRESKSIDKDKERAPPRPKFTKPTVEEVELLGLGINAQEFWDFYEANGWRVGQNPMKDWRAAARNWKRRQGQFKSGSGSPRTASNETTEYRGGKPLPEDQQEVPF